MRRALSILPLLLVLAIPAFADENAGEHDLVNVPLRPHTLALEFGLKSGGLLNSFNGSTLSLRYQRSTHASWRFALSYGVDHGHESQFERYPQSYTENSYLDRYDDESDDSQVYSTSLMRITCPAPRAVIKSYLGIGPAFTVTRTKSHRFEQQTTVTRDTVSFSRTYRSDSFNRGWGAGVTAVVGAEWLVNKRISVHAEYGQTAEYSERRYRYRSEYSGTYLADAGGGFRHRWTSSGRSVVSGLTVFF